jgi:aerobic carbon-monoxide dehydrogenase small subunit
VTAVAVELMVNGRRYRALVDPRQTLAEVLRDDLALTGTHVGCEHGVCGACTVLVDGAAVRSCLLFAVQAEGSEVTTVEGLADGDELHPVQQAFWDSLSFQCGFCTPGFVLSTVALLRESADRDPLSDEEIRVELSGHICRCSGYQAIVAGVRLALDRQHAWALDDSEPS